MNIDREHLKNLLGGEAMIERFIETFYQETKQLCQALENQLESKDLKAIAITTHSLKSHLKMVGDQGLAQLAERIEHSSESGNFNNETQSNCNKLIAELKS